VTETPGGSDARSSEESVVPFQPNRSEPCAQFLIGVSPSGYRSANLQFAPLTVCSASPSNSTSDSHLPLDSLASLPIGLQLAPLTIFQPSLPVDLRLASPIFPSSSAFQSTRGRRHLSIFRPAFRLTSSLRLRPIFRLNLSVHVQLAPSANVRALPSNLTSDSHRLLRSPGAALWFTCDRRRILTFRPCLQSQPPNLIVRCILRLLKNPSSTCAADRSSVRLRIQPSTPRMLCPFGAAFRLAFGLRLVPPLQPSLWTQPPTRQLLCSPVVRSG
jgi:hypothetical protein